MQEFSPGTVHEQQLRDGAPHFQHISGWGVVVVLLSYCLSSPTKGLVCCCPIA